jgi:hypothetical protein
MAKKNHIPLTKMRMGRFLFLLITMASMFILRPFLEAYVGISLLMGIFVPITTLGYGDMTPISSPARSLALPEAIMGQLYIPVMIARLVGIHIVQSLEKKEGPKI